mmetsp:Transcript_46668/g.117575  ORF Transcript_46668/g.117575 Transcript_46668/m.117575 type:complete len:219 (+) Transcript_46668:1967-2623(+)
MTAASSCICSVDCCFFRVPTAAPRTSCLTASCLQGLACTRLRSAARALLATPSLREPSNAHSSLIPPDWLTFVSLASSNARLRRQRAVCSCRSSLRDASSFTMRGISPATAMSCEFFSTVAQLARAMAAWWGMTSCLASISRTRWDSSPISPTLTLAARWVEQLLMVRSSCTRKSSFVVASHFSICSRMACLHMSTLMESTVVRLASAWKDCSANAAS